MAHIKTESGFECDIDESQLSDYRLMMAIREAQASPVAVVDVVRFVLGADGEAALIEHLVETTGHASMEDMKAAVAEIFSQLNESKKK